VSEVFARNSIGTRLPKTFTKIAPHPRIQRSRYFLRSARARATRVRRTVNVRRAVSGASERHGSSREFWDGSLRACSAQQVRETEIGSPSRHFGPTRSSPIKVTVICICKNRRIWGKCAGCDALTSDLDFYNKKVPGQRQNIFRPAPHIRYHCRRGERSTRGADVRSRIRRLNPICTRSKDPKAPRASRGRIL